MKPLTIFIVAGDPSGDLAAAELVSELKRQSGPTPPRFLGAGGPAMAAAGVHLRYELTRHSVIGIEILRQILWFRHILEQLTRWATTEVPEVVIGVDYAGFNLRLAAALRQKTARRRGPFSNWHPRMVQFVSPQVWASRPGRARRMERTHDLLLSILPFEREWYARNAPRLPVRFVGHPIVDRHAHAPAPFDVEPMSETKATLVLLPGSRPGELQRHLPVMVPAARKRREPPVAEFEWFYRAKNCVLWRFRCATARRISESKSAAWTKCSEPPPWRSPPQGPSPWSAPGTESLPWLSIRRHDSPSRSAAGSSPYPISRCQISSQGPPSSRNTSNSKPPFRRSPTPYWSFSRTLSFGTKCAPASEPSPGPWVHRARRLALPTPFLNSPRLQPGREFQPIRERLQSKCSVHFSVDGPRMLDLVTTTIKPLGEREMRSAWRRRDDAYDGLFVFGVTTTRIYCRPSCPSQPDESHLVFFRDSYEARLAGYRACRRCTPDARSGEPPDWIKSLLRQLSVRAARKVTSADLQSWGFAPERVRRWFQKQHGMTFAAWWRSNRLYQAKGVLRAGGSMEDAVFEQGFESHSGFRSAFAREFGSAPGGSRSAGCLCVTLVPTPLD